MNLPIDIINKIESGSIGSVYSPFRWKKPSRYLAFIIRKITRSRFSHSVLFVRINEKLYVAEMVFHAKLTPFEQWVKDYEVHISRIHSELTPEEITNRILSKQGFTGYDLKSLVWYQILKSISKKWFGRTEASAEKKLYCSEYCALVYKEHFKNWFTLSPSDLKKEIDNGKGETYLMIHNF